MDLERVKPRINHYRLKVCLFDDEVRVIMIIRFAVMLQVLVDHLICDITCTPTTITNCPKVTTSITLFQLWELQLKFPRRATLQQPYQVTG